MNNLEDILEFVRKHGTPKLRWASDAELRQYLAWADAAGHLIFVPGQLLFIGWPCSAPSVLADPSGTTLYIANFCRDRATDAGAAMAQLLRVGSARWPHVRRFCGHRIAAARRWIGEGDPRLTEYPMSAVPRLIRFAA